MGEQSESYRTQVRDVDFYGDEKVFADGGEATVTWDLTMEGRSWGIKDLDVVLQAVEVRVATEHWETEERKDFVASWSVAQPNGWNVQVSHEDAKLPLDVYPRNVTIHVLEKRIEVTF
jgi:hypothetical protein